MYLVAGLGNPGPKYRNTRHNIGFRVINDWAMQMNLPLKGRRFQSRFRRTKFEGKDITLLRPVTFMNLSGRALKACIDHFRIRLDHVVVVHDDLDLPLGRVKVTRNGGPGGHKGVLSIMEHIGARNFHRVKIGIGRPFQGETIEEYVLSPFARDEKEIVKEVVFLGTEACKVFVSEGLDAAMNKINCQILKSKEVKN